VPSLVTYDEAADYLGLLPGTDKQLITDLISQAQALFENQVGRVSAPFGPALPGRIEIHQGDPGSALLQLDYPIDTITSIGIGIDVNSPDVAITPSDTSTVVWEQGGRSLVRTDGGYWNHWAPTWVRVVYDTMDDRPADVKAAILSRVDRIYSLRGKQGFSSITRGAKSWTMAPADQEDPTWEAAVSAHGRAWFK